MSEDDIQAKIKAQLKPQLPKRFYKHVSVVETGNGYGIELDGRSVKTKARHALIVPRHELAELMAGEWQDQGEFINPATMPLTRIANTALDLVAVAPEPAVTEILSYAASDLVCYRASTPRALAQKQDEMWSPILALVEEKLGAGFKTTTGVVHLEQPGSALSAIKNWLAGEGFFSLAAEHTITTITGSALITWALATGGISEGSAWEAAHVDEDWQISQWGVDDEAAARAEGRKEEFRAAVKFLSVIMSSDPKSFGS